MFPSVRITPNGGAPIVINAPGAKADELQYISSVTLGNPGRPVRWAKSWVSSNQLSRGATVNITLTTDPASTR